ncbi:MAG: T9SS type A sorting domain-containing protein [Bacteroidota bacterium]|nr:T9SS type A sorting domain-containing protein [Bacteroidota bacterium]
MATINGFSVNVQNNSGKFSTEINSETIDYSDFETRHLLPELSVLNKNSISGKTILQNSGFFRLAYNGNGVDHMNINLVNLDLAGIIIGDEIGVFDGDICAGAAVILEKHIIDNSISIPASANDGTENNQNGYIPGHKITLKLYRNKTVYKLYFQAVNNTNDVFEKWESMFAVVDFSKSTGQSPLEFVTGIKIYPNPFAESVRIEINLPQKQPLTVDIFNMSGQLIKTLFKGDAERQTILVWDGKDKEGKKVTSGIYLCQSNQTIVKINYQTSPN